VKSCCVLDCSRYYCYADRQVPLFQVDIRRNVHALIVGRAALCLLDVIVIVSSVKLCDSKYGRLGGIVSVWQIGKGWFTPPHRVSKCVTASFCSGLCHVFTLEWKSPLE